jgi:glycosyltransferase involved in cell wall biosynthesis
MFFLILSNIKRFVLINTIFISLDGMTDPLGQSQVLPYLGGLSKLGYNFWIISLEKEEAFSKNRLAIENICNASNIKWHPIRYKNKLPIYSPFLNLKNVLSEAENVIRTNKINLLHCRAYFPSIVGLKIKKKHNIPFIFDMRGFFADERIDGGQWNLNNPIYKKVYNYFKKKEKLFLTESAHNISLTYEALKHISAIDLKGKKLSPTTVIPCCADLNHFSIKDTSKENSNLLRKKLNITAEKYVLVYLGAVGSWYMTNEMMQFFVELKKEKKEALFLILTAEEPKIVFDSAKKAGILFDDIRVIKASRKEVPEYLLFCDSSVFFIKPAFSKKASSPTKLGELLSMGIPVVCNSGVGDVNEIVTKSNTGVIVNDFKESTLNAAAKQILSYPRGEKLREKAESVIDFFSLEEGIKRYASVYEKVVGKP